MLFIILLSASASYADNILADIQSGFTNIFSTKDVCLVDSGQASLQAVVEQAEKAMSHNKCVRYLGEYIETMLNTAATTDPGAHVYTAVGQFIANQATLGRVGKLEAKNLVKTYFKKEFVTFSSIEKKQMSSLVCEYGAGTDMQLRESLAEDAKNELRKKELGMLKAMDDPAAYRSTQDFYDMSLVLLEGGCIAAGNKIN